MPVISICFHFSAYKNCNAGIAATSKPATSYWVFAYKIYNVGVAAADVSGQLQVSILAFLFIKIITQEQQLQAYQ